MNNEKWLKKVCIRPAYKWFSYKVFRKIEYLPVFSQEKGNRSRFLHLVMPLIVGCAQMPSAYGKSFPIYQGKIGYGNQLQLVAVGQPQPHCWSFNCSLWFLIRKRAFMYGGVSCFYHVHKLLGVRKLCECKGGHPTMFLGFSYLMLISCY
jgi:hypothetical protein